MKYLIAVAGALALAACGGAETEAGDEAAGADDAAVAALPSTSAGTYVGTDVEGNEITVVMNEDGTFEDRMGDEVVATGTWEDNIRGTCFTEEGGEGEECYNMGEVGEDGTLEVTGPDGVTMTMEKTA